jgi:hypothetical protein
VGDCLGDDLLRDQFGFSFDPHNRWRARQSSSFDKSGPMLLHGERRLGLEDVLRAHVVVLSEWWNPRRRSLQRELRLRLPSDLLFWNGGQRLVSRMIENTAYGTVSLR